MPFMLALALGLGIAGWAPRPAPGSPAAVTPAPGVKPWEADPKGHMVGGGGLQQSLLHRPGGGNPPRRRLRPVAGVERTEGCRTRTVPQDTPQDTARAYLEDTFAALRDKGHIQDCRIDSLEFIPPGVGRGIGGDQLHDLRRFGGGVVSGRVLPRPTRPELTHWQGRGGTRTAGSILPSAGSFSTCVKTASASWAGLKCPWRNSKNPRGNKLGAHKTVIPKY